MNAALPKQIQAQLEDADRIQQGLTAPQDSQEPVDPTVTPPSSPVLVEPPAPPQPPAQPVNREEDAGYWKQRFATLEGMYRTDTGNLRQSLGQIQGQLEALQRQPAPQQPQPSAPEHLVTAKDVETFGEDMVSVMRRAAREELGTIERGALKRLEAIERTIAELRPQVGRVAQVEQRVAQTQATSFDSELAAAVPNWQEINVDQRWLQWLAAVDPVAGKTRQACLDEAAGVFDAKRVAAVFKLFTEQTGWKSESAAQANVQSELARQVAPSRSATTTPTPHQARTFTGKDYEYWTDHRRVHDQPKEVLAQMLAELERAVYEGRVKW